MKKRTIEKVLDKKFHDFTQSIKDEKVRTMVIQNSLISGGCIASMLLKEPINDYDIYFLNKETALAVANYYAPLFMKARSTVVDVDKLDNMDKMFYEQHGISGPGRVAIYCEANQQSPDSDVTMDDVEELTGVILNENKNQDDDNDKYKPLYLSPNAISLSHKVQLILRFYGSPEEIHSNYDYVHATNYWTLGGGLKLNQPALEAILAKELIYIGSKYPLASILRCKKFLLREWSINAGQQLKIMYQISKLDLDNISVLEDQLVGVDVAYFIHLISELKAHIKATQEKNISFTLSYEYLPEIIDRVFNR
jgi:hypothetical protein